ncbi:uncharacterized protein LOC126560698 [Anopheles maculipalpis]|uniref:uncharacterized protein LOC126560698 n=1 Tax=Anopheles maculipalpis TaxID=1496333 RepID=UPI0021598CE5|nr:uncharacterized protein LOC126560698 [Anopheles maculipalpis]
MEDEQRRLSQQFEALRATFLPTVYGQQLLPNAAPLDQHLGAFPNQHPPSLSIASPSQHPPSLSMPSTSQHPPSQSNALQNGEPSMSQLIQLMQQFISKLDQPPVSLPQIASEQQPVSQPQMAPEPQQLHQGAPFNSEQILDILSRNITEFRFEADNDITFEKWYSCYEDLFSKDAARVDDAAKVRLLLRKLGILEHERYVNYIAPRNRRDFTLEATVERLKKVFGKKESLLSKSHKCIQIVKTSAEDFLVYACRVNRACVDFELSRMSEEQFKCLIFVCGLKEEAEKDF